MATKPRPWTEQHCWICGQEYLTEEDWEARHTCEDGEDCHAECCDVCSQEPGPLDCDPEDDEDEMLFELLGWQLVQESAVLDYDEEII